MRDLRGIEARRLLAFCSPVYEDVALNELARLLEARPVSRLEPGLVVLDVALDRDEIELRLRGNPPIFARLVVCGAVAVERTGEIETDIAAVLKTSETADFDGLMACDAAGRRPAAIRLLQDRLNASARFAVPAKSSAAVIATHRTLWVGRILAGAGLPMAPLWPGGRPDYGFDPTLVSRSALKLMEAIEVFSVETAPLGRALDLGASPGGWTQVLAGRGMMVDAVDPGILDPRILTLRGVTAHAITAQRFLASTPDRFDLIVDDMRLDARESARILLAAAENLQQGGEAIITLKLPERRPSDPLRHALDLLMGRFTSVRARCLYYNRHEVTAHVRLG